MIEIKLVLLFVFVFMKTDTVRCIENFEVVNGDTADIRDAPYQVAINYMWPSCYFCPSFLQREYLACGGAILEKHWIVTAAHCINKGYAYFIRAGSSRSDEGGKVYEIKNIFPHKDYDPRSFEKMNDIATLELYEGIVFDDTRKAIDLAEEAFNLREKYELKIYSYGRTGANEPISIQLMNVTLEVQPHATCEENFVLFPADLFCVIDKKRKSTGMNTRPAGLL